MKVASSCARLKKASAMTLYSKSRRVGPKVVPA